MIERAFVKQNKIEFQIQEFITNSLKNVGHSHTKLQKTPLGEKIVIFASRPGLIVGREGSNIKKLTIDLKKRFKLENPQIEINEVENINLDARIVAERIASDLERFGTSRFKGIGHKVMQDVMNAKALGIEILMSGKIPSSRAKKWRFYRGYLKKCGDIALTGVDKAYTKAQLKTGIVGIQVRIMPPGTKLPDKIELIEEQEEITEETEKNDKGIEAVNSHDKEKELVQKVKENKEKKIKKTKSKETEIKDQKEKSNKEEDIPKKTEKEKDTNIKNCEKSEKG